jgi:glycosyltransferase involved in cell wall biosynthesis
MSGTAGPLVSVVIPTFNRAQYIVSAVESVLAQRDACLELIVVDDGSTDDTAERLQPYLDRIRYVSQENAGAGASRNRGMALANGEYIAFLDSDDLWQPTKLALQVAYMEAHDDVDLVCTDFGGFNDSGPLAQSYIAEFCEVVGWRQRRFDQIYPLQDEICFGGATVAAYRGNVFDTVFEGYLTLTSTVLMRRRCIETCGFFPEHLPTSEDVAYFQRVARHHSFAFLDTPTTWYRRGHQDQLSSDQHGAETLRVWLALAERVRRNDRGYYEAHRELVDGVIRFRKSRLAWTLYQQHRFAPALSAIVASLVANPRQLRAYAAAAIALANVVNHGMVQLIRGPFHVPQLLRGPRANRISTPRQPHADKSPPSSERAT